MQRSPMPPLLLLLLLLLLDDTTTTQTTTSTPTPSPPHQQQPDLSATLRHALSHALRLSPVLSSSTILEKQRGALRDCRDLHLVTLSSLRLSRSLLFGNLTSLLRLHLSAALSNRDACLDGLRGSSGPSIPSLLAAVSTAYSPVSDSLARVPTASGRDRRVQPADDDHGGSEELVVTVAKDGSGNFTGVGQAVRWVPSNGEGRRVVIVVRAGVYEENVEVGADKVNVFMVGEGSGVTVIRGRRNAADGWTTFRSATVAISGRGFVARDITFENVAGPSKGQAAAIRVNADLAAFYRCTIAGYQDTLYSHSFRQFYRECLISGTVDFVFGNAAAVFQACTFVARLPLHGHANVVTAQGREEPNEPTGISIHRCSIVASEELAAADPGAARTYLGRPWKPYSRTVVVGTYMGRVVDPAGWSGWTGDDALETLYYGEYGNNGPGSATERRVRWPGFREMSYKEAEEFTVGTFIQGDQWLGPTSIPYDDGV